MQEALRRHPPDKEKVAILNNIACASLWADAFTNAQRYAADAEKAAGELKEPPDWVLKRNQGVIYDIAKDYVKALDYYKASIGLNGNQPEVRKAIQDLTK